MRSFLGGYSQIVLMQTHKTPQTPKKHTSQHPYQKNNKNPSLFASSQKKTLKIMGFSLLVGGFSPTHLKNMIVKMGSSSPNRGENKTYLSCHHLVYLLQATKPPQNSTLDCLGWIHAPPNGESAKILIT